MVRAWNAQHGTCSFACSVRWAEAAVARKRRREGVALRRAQVAERKTDRARLLALKPLAWHIAGTQAACNAYVRLRDAGKPCICCGRQTYGEPVDAGHFISRGSAPELRFDLDNLHVQLRGCNRGRRVVPRERFRRYLAKRIGLARVEALEGPHPPRKWTREELVAMKAEFRALARALERS